MRKMNGVERLLIWLYILPLAFDFRGEAGGSAIQYVLATTTLSSGILFIVVNSIFFQTRYRGSTGVGGILIVWWMFLAGSILTAAMNGVPVERYLRVVFPFLLCGMSMWIAHLCIRRNIDPRDFVLPLIVAAAISVFWIFIFQVLIVADEESARYRLVSAIFPIIIGYTLSVQLTRGGVSPLMALLAVGAVAIIAIALTRGAAVSVLAIGLGFLTLRRYYHEATNRLGIIRLVSRFVLLLISGLIIAVAINPDVLGEWYLRLTAEKTKGGEQITAITRIAEYSWQIKAWMSSPLTLLFGRGLGSTFEWDWQFLGVIAQYLPRGGRDALSHWFAGHGIFVYSFYASGLLLGWVVPGVFLYSLWRSFLAAKAPNSIREVHLRKMAPLPFLVILGFLPFSLVANPFWLRLGGLTIGFIFALSCWLFSALNSAQTYESSDGG